MRPNLLRTCVVVAGVVTGACAWKATSVHGASGSSSAADAINWNPTAAATYLDSREVWWQSWPAAKRDHGTICISCHTVLPYAMARPGLRTFSHELDMAAPEKIMMDSVQARVSGWSEMLPFYSDAADGVGKTAQSHATEAILNAVILTSYDARQGHLRPITRDALAAAWALQEKTGDYAGGWIWQDFHLAPWESADSNYQGAAFFAVAVGNAPDHYAQEAAVRRPLEGLEGYLRGPYAAQPLINQLYVLWASGRIPGLLTDTEQKALTLKVTNLQQADGGWRTASLDQWLRSDKTEPPAGSDGFATALVVLTLEESGAVLPEEPVRRGLTWLEQHQQPQGNWVASSLNKQRDPESNVGRFMNDAATGYAVLALEKAH